MKKSLLMVGGLVGLLWGGDVRAADFFTAPVLVRQNELVTCQALNIGKNSADLTVELIDTAVGSIFGPATCPTLTGGTCGLASVSGSADDRLVYCRVAPGKKKNVRAAIQVNGGGAAPAQ